MDHFKVLADNAWSLVCVDCGEGFMWMVIGHYMSEPTKRVIGESWEEDNPKSAIEDAVNFQGTNSYSYKYAFEGF